MVGWFSDEGLVADAPPVVGSAGERRQPALPADRGGAPRRLAANEVLLLDLWGKLPAPGAVFADITWVGFTGSGVPDEYASAFAAARDGRDAAVDAGPGRRRANGRELRGFEVDRALPRRCSIGPAYGAQFIHRTGHSLGEEVHGNGVHMDDYETHDERRLIPGTGFTIEPGVYSSDFGVRTEINMFVGEREATVTGPLQTEIRVSL